MGEPGTSSAAGSTQSGASSSSGDSGGGGGTKLDMDPSTMTADELKQFIDTGRTGRRNALPDVTEEGVITTSTADVSDALSSLSFQSGR